jgi:hypothetical protein
MDAAQILDRLAVIDTLPVEAIRAADADRASMAPVFVQAIEQYLAVGADQRAKDALFFIFHMLGSWRETSAYRPLARLLRRPSEELRTVLFDAAGETSHRVVAAVFDGDPQPLYDVILDPAADEYVRSRMCEALAMVTLRGELPRAEAARFLRACWSDIEPQDECFVWDGWQSAIAMLGLAELAPLVEQAFARGFISPGWLSLENFKDDLRRTTAGAAPPRWRNEHEYTLFGDAIEELSTWAAFEPKPAEASARDAGNRIAWPRERGPAVNPFKGIGRNDPCPCGSGKKFKKCCLDKPAASPRDIGALLGSPHDAGPEIEDAIDAALDEEAPSTTMYEYDPVREPNSDAWLATDEQERIALVEDYHRRARIRVPNAKAHAALHAIVENQVAEGDAMPVRRTLLRLMAEGLDRHDAVHAIGSVLAGYLHDLLRQPESEPDPNPGYYAELEQLTAESWRRSG